MAGVNIDKIREKMKKIEEEKASRGKGMGDKKFYTLQSGKNLVRIMPPFNDEGDFYMEGGYHHQVGPDKKSIACTKAFGRGKCAICALVDELFKGDASDKKLAKTIKMRRRFFFNAYVPKANEEEYEGKKVFILPVAKTVFDDIISTIADPEWGDITNPKKGYNCTITKTGKELETEYSTVFSPNPSAVAKEFLEEIYDLNEEFDAMMPSPADVTKVLTGEGEDEDEDEKPRKKHKKPVDEDDDEEEAPPKKSSGKTTKKPSKPDPDEDDEDENPDCFGEHEDGEDTCIECPVEDACAKVTKKGKSRKSH